jgi:serine/threonine protein kinase
MASPLLLAAAEEFAGKTGLSDIRFKGKGSFKETYRATTTNGQYVALKLLDPSKCNLSRSQREINSMQKCNTPLIAKLYDYGNFCSSNGTTYYFSLEEFLDGGTLTDQINNGKLTPDIIRGYALALVEALAYLRSINIVHRDIKPDNIMFRLGYPVPVLVDFGLARDLSESSLTPSWLMQGPGTPYYSAPEQLNNEKQLIDWRTDQFCLGIVLGICLTGQHPFSEKGMTPSETVTAVSERKPCTQEFCKVVSSLGFSLVIKMLDPWPHRRYQSSEELLKILASKA